MTANNQHKTHARWEHVSNGANRTRTDDLLHAMQAFSQLNYSPADIRQIQNSLPKTIEKSIISSTKIPFFSVFVNETENRYPFKRRNPNRIITEIRHSLEIDI